MSLIVGLCQIYGRFLVLSHYNDSCGSKKIDFVFFEISISRKIMIETLMEEVMQFFFEKNGFEQQDVLILIAFLSSLHYHDSNERKKTNFSSLV